MVNFPLRPNGTTYHGVNVVGRGPEAGKVVLAAGGIAAIAKEVGLSRQAVYRIKDDYSASAEAALALWGL